MANDTDQDVTPPEETTQVPPPTETEEPSQDATPSVEELQEKLAAAESEAKTWKGRVEKATKKSPPISEEDIDWKIANTARIALVKEQYEKELSELEAEGIKLTNRLREKALKLAESATGVKKPQSDEPLPTPSVDRSGGTQVKLSSYAQALGVKKETVEKYRDYVEGR